MTSIYNYAKELEICEQVLDMFITNISEYKLIQILKIEKNLINSMLNSLYYVLTEDMLKSTTTVRLSEILFGSRNILSILKTPEDYKVSFEMEEKLFKNIFLYETDLVCKSKNNKFIVFRLNSLNSWTDSSSIEFTTTC